MSLSPGARLGPYEIISPIGAGGMGEVYRARDTRLERTVAIKILPETLAGSGQLKLRFEREAKAISSLAHPHICTLHDVGSDRGIDFLVMEHLEGETLAQRLERGSLPLDEALRYAIQIADALDKAHRRGIVHRDLKPGNVMLTRGGAKLLDFGLARSIDTERISAESATLMAPLTRDKPLTAEGSIVGTFQYMAPEQLDGRPADARTDIFAFGAVLYEMMTGKRAFDGKSRASVIAAIIAAEPPAIAALRPLTPPDLDRVVSICLRKDPDERWQSAWDLRLELESLLASSTRTAAASRSRRGPAAGWIAAAVILALAAGAALWDRNENHRSAAPTVLEIAPPKGKRFNATDGPAAISPDGSHIVVGLSEGNPDGLYIRSLDSPEFRPLPGAEGGYDAFWSPDSREVGFFASGKMRRINISNGTLSTIASVTDGRAASWGKDGVILYAPTPRSPIYRISQDGGTPSPVTRLDPSREETGHWRPSFLPDGRHFTFIALSADPERSGVYLGSLDSKDVKRVLDMPTTTFFSDGHLFYFNQDNFYAVPLDPGSGEKGEARLVARNVASTPQFAVAAASVAKNGTFVFNSLGDAVTSSLSKIDITTGAAEPLAATGFNLDLSLDGNFLAYMNSSEQNRNNDLWVHDLRRNISSRLTFEPQDEFGPVWSPDGRTIAYSVTTQRGSEVYTRSANGSNPVKLLDAVEFGIEIVDWSPDGKTLIAEQGSIENRTDLVTIDVATRKVIPFANRPFREASGRFSPDGKWIAYTSDETGTQEIYVQPFPADGSRAQVSNRGGESPRWAGSSLLYVAVDLSLMSVDVDTKAGKIELSVPRSLTPLGTSDYDVLPGGKAVIASRRDSPHPTPIVVMSNWRGRSQ